jgi:hypothetical protein
MLPETATRNDGDRTQPLESQEEIDAYVQHLVDRAALAGVPGNAVVIIVDMPASMRSPVARERAEHMNATLHDRGPGRIRIYWETPFEYVGMHRERILSFEMCLARFPILKEREDAIRDETNVLEQTRNWWSSVPPTDGRVPGTYRSEVYRCALWDWTETGRRAEVQCRDFNVSSGITVPTTGPNGELSGSDDSGE